MFCDSDYPDCVEGLRISGGLQASPLTGQVAALAVAPLLAPEIGPERVLPGDFLEANFRQRTHGALQAIFG